MFAANLPTPSADDFWSALRELRPNQSRLEDNRLIPTAQADAAHVPIDMLRTRVAAMMEEKGWKTLAVTSPTAGCGKTTIAVNLAFSMARRRQGRVVLIDLDFRRPRVGTLLEFSPKSQLEDLFEGKARLADCFSRIGNNLAVAVNTQPVGRAAELLHSETTKKALAEIQRDLQPDMIICDLPPMLVNDDFLAFQPSIDCSLLVAGAEYSTIGEIDVCERELGQHETLLGVVLNKCRYSPARYGYGY
ncbi:CpsD/CapB family tyrosine-protein kinase [Paradevosia shaoguanensis]|jgi:Mrp family chromosome partitioning ATPase|uniref:CpsD/CapB family tyrosine-protein kinase n=1 Tax=Paradevosia shaoguanensis TaxID=1335043 RepID=A0AA41QJN1_9HYPH|nr:CpsD/CapB family tyrosine-protein kinase [Paradevosia shaoguanensis]MCF1740889.1 CpsD/CapB family tyrosine-protein kinase [Paradevosia shaoguanensis]MCI0125373.1 CpsD/CapB family tyrosine-protein kinase [Paradevosia shaoguanensis]CDP53225.1 Exopolysaccharide biosynthesis domain protein [Devosia sp. DBB001]